MMSAFCLKIMPDYLRASILLGQSISVMQMFSNPTLMKDKLLGKHIMIIPSPKVKSNVLQDTRAKSHCTRLAHVVEHV